MVAVNTDDPSLFNTSVEPTPCGGSDVHSSDTALSRHSGPLVGSVNKSKITSGGAEVVN